MGLGREWIVDAYGCPPARIGGDTGREALTSLFANVIRTLDLHPVSQAVWHVFSAHGPATQGAVTGMVALAESHLTCHSDPASGWLSVNLSCTRPDLSPDWRGLLTRFVGAHEVSVQVVERGRAPAQPAAAPLVVAAQAPAAASQVS